jgi:biofilm PGA synthesis lipoprotein PgaB
VVTERLVARLLTLVTLAVGAVPFAGAWLYLRRDRPDVAAQHQTAGSDAAPVPVAGWRLPANAAPVALAYHDVRPDSTDRYTVSPAQLDQQLTALEAAGYRTLSSAEYVAYLQGGPVPPRSVYLTFDDGASGLWEYADPVLAKHHAHGAAYLITGQVSRPGPYYLSWDEVARMRGSGRWDFQAHTHDMHRQVATGPDGDRGSKLANLSWDADTGSLQSVAEHDAQVGADLTAMFAAFATQGLPAPRLFAYPFS